MLELDRPAWLSISIGTSNGFSITMRPVSTTDKPIGVPDGKEHGAFVRTMSKLVNTVHKSGRIADHVRRRVLSIGSYDISASGLGLNIPILAASVNFNRDPRLPLS